MVYEEMLVAATDGTLAADIRPLIRLSISVLVEQDGKRERGSAGAGGRFGLEWFFESYKGEQRAVYFAKRICASSIGKFRRGGGAGRINAGGVGRWLAGGVNCTKQ